MSATELIDSFAETVTVTQGSGAGSWVNGVFVPGATTPISVEMSVQPMRGRELINVPEAQRTRRWMKGYTATQLTTADQAGSTKADLVAYDGTSFEVQKVERWRGDLNFYRIEMVEVNA